MNVEGGYVAMFRKADAADYVGIGCIVSSQLILMGLLLVVAWCLLMKTQLVQLMADIRYSKSTKLGHRIALMCFLFTIMALDSHQKQIGMNSMVKALPES